MTGTKNHDGTMTLVNTIAAKIAMVFLIWTLVFAFGAFKSYAAPSEEEMVGLEQGDDGKNW